MDQAIDKDAARPAPLVLSRVFAAPRETVFRAWSSAEHVKRWFCPQGYTVPQARVELRVGGPFEVCMRSPDGIEHWTRGVFAEVSPVERLVLDLQVTDGAGAALFGAHTEVSFADAPEGTRMDVVQSYSLADPAHGWMVAGAPEGWRQTLDKLEAELARMAGVDEVHRRKLDELAQAEKDGAKRSVVHGDFHLERTYDAPIERVYAALSNEAAKAKWFASDRRLTVLERSMDFRVGGRERARGRWPGGVVSTFDATYYDIIPNERIVYTYEMHLDDRKISVSLATLQLSPAGEGRTRLKVSEQGAFLDGYDDGGARERGTGELLDKLGASLAQA